MIFVGLLVVSSAILIMCGCALMVLPTVIAAEHIERLETHRDPPSKPTKLDKLIKAYMAQDALDPTSTINFLMEVDGLEDPFAEAPMLPPPKPSDAATSARPPRARKCQVCGQIGSFSGGVCHVCGGRATHPSWAIWSDGGAVDYRDKRSMEEDAYQLQKEGKKITIFDSYGKQLFVAPPPVLMASGGVQRIGLSNRWRDSRELERQYEEQFTALISMSSTAKQWFGSIQPMDEPYPIEHSWPGKTIRD